MSAKKTDALLNRFIAIAVTFNLSCALVFVVFSGLDKFPDREKIHNRTEALTATGTFFLSLAVMINAFFAAKRAEALRFSALAAEKNNELGVKNLELAEERLIAERFMTAITQLGHSDVATRTGAIYTLERVAQNCPKQYWTIIEILTAFVRENAASKPQDEDTAFETSIRTDIQVALTVIGRRDAEKDPENQQLDLRNTDIRKADLSGANLKRADLRGSDLSGVDLRASNLCEANLDDSKLVGANLYEADLQSSNLRSANLYAANLNRAWASKANMQAANLSGASLRGANLSSANLYKANLQQANLKVANLQEAKLFLANLSGAKLGKANLQGAGLIGANLQQANLNGANLEQANLNAAKLQHTEVFFANLSGASLTQANLSGANLMGANLQQAILYEANLSGANLMGANLFGTNLCDVKLEGAILTGAKNLEPDQITVALGDRSTRLPENVEVPTHWRQSS